MPDNGGRSRRRFLLMLGVSAALALSACGSSGSNGSSGSGGASGAAAGSASNSSASGTASSGGSATSGASASASGRPLIVGSICSCSGVQAAQLGLGEKIIQVWASYINSNGGLNGHPVRVITEDDGGVAGTALKQAKELVEQDHVMAIVGESSLVDASFANYVKSKGIPIVGGTSYETSFQSNPDFYPSGATLLPVLYGDLAIAKAEGSKKSGIYYCAESPICAQLVPIMHAMAPIVGIQVLPQSISSTAPNYTAPCLAAKSAGVDSLDIVANSNVVLRFADACAQQNYKPLQVTTVNTATPTWLTDPNVNGAFLVAQNANPYGASIPGVKTFQQALTKYAPGLFTGKSFSPGQNTMVWAGGMLFAAAAKAAKLTPSSTPADVKKGLYALKNETLDGLAGPLNFTPAKPNVVPCWFIEKVSDGKFTAQNGNKATCMSSAQLTKLTASLGS